MEHNRRRATATTIGKLKTLWVIAAGAHEKIKLALNAPQREEKRVRKCFASCELLTPLPPLPTLLGIADNSVCRFTWGATPQQLLCAPLCGMHVCLLDVISMRLWDLFFDSEGERGSSRESSWKWQTNNQTRRWKVCCVCCMSNQTPEHRTHANYSISRIRGVATRQLTFTSSTQTLLITDKLRYNGTSE